jgi:hypothetical protein
MAKKELIDSGRSGRYVLRTETGRFIAKGGSASASVKEKKGVNYRSAVSGRFVTVKETKSSPVTREYSMPNGDKIVTVRRDIVDRALSRREK